MRPGPAFAEAAGLARGERHQKCHVHTGDGPCPSTPERQPVGVLAEEVGGWGNGLCLKRGEASHSLLSLKRLVREAHPGTTPSRVFPEGTGPRHVQWVQGAATHPRCPDVCPGQAPAAVSQRLQLCMGARWVEKKTPERLVLGPQTIAIIGGIVSPQKACVETLTAASSEYDLIWSRAIADIIRYREAVLE